MKRIYLQLIISIFLVSCATSYHKIDSFNLGYSETHLGTDTFRVSFHGNKYTNEEIASDFCLLRSAELALSAGYKYFIIVESNNSLRYSAYTTPFRAQVRSTGRIRVSGGQTTLSSEPRATNTIRCYKDKPNIEEIVFDAEFISSSIRKKYPINEKQWW